MPNDNSKKAAADPSAYTVHESVIISLARKGDAFSSASNSGEVKVSRRPSSVKVRTPPLCCFRMVIVSSVDFAG